MIRVEIPNNEGFEAWSWSRSARGKGVGQHIITSGGFAQRPLRPRTMMLASPASTEDFTEPSPRHRKQRSPASTEDFEPSPRHRKQRSPASWSDGSDASSEQCPRNESPKSPLDLDRYEVSVETSAEEDTDDGDSPKLGRRLSRKEVEDIEWLKSSTRREMSLLELAFHGTVDLESGRTAPTSFSLPPSLCISLSLLRGRAVIDRISAQNDDSLRD